MNDMRVFLTILRGPNPTEAKPLFATEDDDLIALVAHWIEARLSPAHRHDLSQAPAAPGGR